MKSLHKNIYGLVTAQAAIIVAVIIGATGILIYQWHNAHHDKGGKNSASEHHHKKKHEEKTASAK